MTLGKGIGGGVPLAALLATESMCCFAPGDQGGTFNGNPLTCAAGLAVMNTLSSPGFLEAVQAQSRHLKRALIDLAAEYNLGEVRGRGLLMALDTRQNDATVIAAKAFEQGLLINAPQPYTLRFMPALTVTKMGTDQMIAILREILK